MSFLDMFKNKSFDAGIMDHAEFQRLCKRTQELDSRLNWSLISHDRAAGSLRGSIVGQQINCGLRPLENERHLGLVFFTYILPAPPPASRSAMQELMDRINEVLFVEIGAAVNLEQSSGLLHFTTIMLQGAEGFTDAKLSVLIDSNISLGNELIRGLVSVHRGDNTVSAAFEGVITAYRRYIDFSISREVKQALERARQARAVHL